jgi:phosphoglycerol transferase MdoB-like AlkP superfamily enzyme
VSQAAAGQLPVVRSPAQARRRAIARATRSAVVSLALAACLAFCVELIVRGSPGQTITFFLEPYRPGWTTVALFALIFWTVDAAIGRAHSALFVVAPLALLLAFVGSQKANYLGDPLYPTDFLYSWQIAELLPLLVREKPVTAALMVVCAVGVIALIVASWRQMCRRTGRLRRSGRLARMAIAAPALIFFTSIMDYATFSWARDRLGIFPMMWDQHENYAHNGFALAFVLNLPMANVDAPEGYSAEAIQAIDAQPAVAGAVTGRKADIIIVMSESFWDPSRLPGVALDPDPIRNVRALQSGNLFSPEFGGMTANVEFEALTGFSNAFLPYGSIPYQQYVRGEVPSLARFLGAQGYDTLAIHPFEGWFWNRAHVYEAFGFDRFLSEETLPALDTRGSLASDAALTEIIIREAEASSEPLFLFAVSLQSHGPYAPGRYPDATHKASAPVSDWARQSIETYAEGISDADKGFQQLIDWASNRDRETIVVFFGDHLPPLGPAYVETGFLDEPVAPRREAPDAMAKHRETPLVVWSNRGGALRNLGTVSPAFLPLLTLRTAGLTHPFYTGFLGEVHEAYQVIDRHLLVDAAGSPRQDWSRGGQVEPLLNDFRLVQHDMLFGEGYAGRTLFAPARRDVGPPMVLGPVPAPAPPAREFRPT